MLLTTKDVKQLCNKLLFIKISAKIILNLKQDIIIH